MTTREFLFEVDAGRAGGRRKKERGGQKKKKGAVNDGWRAGRRVVRVGVSLGRVPIKKKETSWLCTHTGAHTQQRVQNAERRCTYTHTRTYAHSLTHTPYQPHTNQYPPYPYTHHTQPHIYIHTPPRTRLGTIKKRDKPGATCQGTYLLQLGYLQLG